MNEIEEVAAHLTFAIEKTNNLKDYIYDKKNDKNIKLMDYQKFTTSIFLGLETLNSLLLFWETGFGKTITAIYIINNINIFYPDWKIFIFIKTSLYIDPWIKNLDNYANENIRKNIIFIHYDLKDAGTRFFEKIKTIRKTDRILFIIDESHNFISQIIPKENRERKFSKMYNKIIELSNRKFNKILLMSATPIFDKIIEFNYLLKLMRNNVVNFDESFFINEKLINIKELSNSLYGICSYKKITELSSLIDEEGNDQIAKKKIIYHKIIMSDFQSSIYRKVELYEKNITSGGFRILRRMVSSFAIDESKIKRGIDQKTYNKNLIKNLNAFRESIKDITFSSKFIEYFINDNIESYITDSLNLEEEEKRIQEKKNFEILFNYSCKYIRTCKIILSNEGKFLLYEPFVSFEGLVTLLEYFKLFNITYIEYSKNTRKNRDNDVLIFNDINNLDGSKIKICVFSSAGSEGISFNGIMNIIILDIPWSGSSLEQIIGRARRLNSHILLPKEKQYLNVHMLIAFTDDGKSVDNEMLEIIKKKDNRKNEINILLKNISIEKIYNNYKNIKPTENEYIFDILRNKRVEIRNETKNYIITNLIPIYYTFSENFSHIYRGFLDENTDLIYVNSINIGQIKRDKNLIPITKIVKNILVYFCF